jgi:hypothetical protein
MHSIYFHGLCWTHLKCPLKKYPTLWKVLTSVHFISIEWTPEPRELCIHMWIEMRKTSGNNKNHTEHIITSIVINQSNQSQDTCLHEIPWYCAA